MNSAPFETHKIRRNRPVAGPRVQSKGASNQESDGRRRMKAHSTERNGRQVEIHVLGKTDNGARRKRPGKKQQPNYDYSRAQNKGNTRRKSFRIFHSQAVAVERDGNTVTKHFVAKKQKPTMTQIRLFLREWYCAERMQTVRAFAELQEIDQRKLTIAYRYEGRHLTQQQWRQKRRSDIRALYRALEKSWLYRGEGSLIRQHFSDKNILINEKGQLHAIDAKTADLFDRPRVIRNYLHWLVAQEAVFPERKAWRRALDSERVFFRRKLTKLPKRTKKR